MARIDNLTNFLNDVSSAIKQKIGDSAPILASEFDTKIAEIETKGNYQQKSVTISNNGTQIFTPDANYDAIEQIEITTNVPILQLQTKSVEITSNGNISVLPDTEYDGMSQIDLVVNVPSLDTSDATAVADNIEYGKTAYVNGEKIEGTLSPNYQVYFENDELDYELDSANNLEINTYPTGKSIFDRDTKITVKAGVDDLAVVFNVTPDKIKKNETVLGVMGTYQGINTSDATATVSDIVEGKTAYVDGKKIVGTHKEVMSIEEYNEAITITDNLLNDEYQSTYNIMNQMVNTPQDEYDGIGGTPEQIDDTLNTLLGVNN